MHGRDGIMLRALAVVLLILAVVALAAAILYFALPARSLPSFMGRVEGSTVHRSRRAIAGVVVGGLLLVGAGIGFIRSRSSAR